MAPVRGCDRLGRADDGADVSGNVQSVGENSVPEAGTFNREDEHACVIRASYVVFQ
jgi:hypothetical protein